MQRVVKYVVHQDDTGVPGKNLSGNPDIAVIENYQGLWRDHKTTGFLMG